MHNKKRLLCMEVITLSMVGLVMVYSSSYVWATFKFEDPYYFLKRQAIFMFIGFVAMYCFSKIDLLKLRKYNKVMFILGILSLLLVLIPGIGVARNGSRSWFSLASFLIQPSEFFKVILIFCVSDYLAKKQKIKKLKDFIIPLMMAFVGFILILLQPDFGSGMVMVCAIIVILFCAKVPLRYFIYVALLAVLGLSGLIISAPYRMERILSFLDPWSDPLGSGFQMIQSLYAIGPGGVFGSGINGSIQKHFYLPEPQTDFIFAIFGEEFGFLGSVLLLGLFLLVIYEGIHIAIACEETYLSYVSIGLISLFAIQVMINLGVVVGLFPVTGITLPLISYGGSSVIVMLSCFGMIISNTKH
ncbi:MAG: putative lipid II flippase FtsW [Erysipelotrichia bacterium]|nr:putative lipid II flippase FtsW [Erysipelotrichia bacterium]NCC54121.1 putative lipid II flippase FtsW [Erysipelotrichia bacterium]